MAAFPPKLPPGGYVDLAGRGRAWVWDSAGDRPPVVLLHGWTSTAALNWAPTMRPLARSFRVIAPDQRGHGRGLPTRRFTLETCADDVAALLGALGTGPAVVVGYSMGGPVAMLTWRRHPDAVSGLVLAATAGRFPGHPGMAPAVTAAGAGLSLVLAAVPGGWRRMALTRMVEARDPDPERAAWVVSEQLGSDPAALVQAAAALGTFDASDWLGEIDVPTSVIVTSRDMTVPPAAQWRLVRRIPGAEAVTVPGGHRSCVEIADRFVPALRDAVSSVLRRSAGGGAAGDSAPGAGASVSTPLG